MKKLLIGLVALFVLGCSSSTYKANTCFVIPNGTIIKISAVKDDGYLLNVYFCGQVRQLASSFQELNDGVKELKLNSFDCDSFVNK